MEKYRIKLTTDSSKADIRGSSDYGASDLEKRGYFIHYEYKDDYVNQYLEFYMDTPSNQSFTLFGGMYDPKTGYLYATLTKNQRSVVACDLVNIFSNYYSGKKIELKYLNDLFIKYKLSGNTKLIENNILFGDTSIIFRHFNNTLEMSDHLNPFEFLISIPYDVVTLAKYIKTINDDEVFNKGDNFYTIRNSIDNYPVYILDPSQQGAQLNELILFKLSSRKCLERQDISYFYNFYFDEVIKAYVLKENVDDLYDTKETLVYSTDTVATLRRNGFANYVTKEIIPDLKTCDEENPAYRETEKFHKEQQLGYGKRPYNLISDLVSEIIYMNKTFRKLSK